MLFPLKHESLVKYTIKKIIYDSMNFSSKCMKSTIAQVQKNVVQASNLNNDFKKYHNLNI